MKKSIFLAPALLCVLGTGAIAAELTIKGSASSSLRASDNLFMSSAPSGPTYQWTNSLNTDFLASSPSTNVDLKTHLSYFDYLGPGAKDTTLTHDTPVGTTFSVKHKTPLTTYSFSTSWSRADLASTLLSETGYSVGRGSVDTYTTRAGLTRQLSSLDSLSLNAAYSNVTYSGSNSTPYFDITSAINWRHTLSTTTTLNNSVNFDWYNADDAANSQRLYWTVMSGATSHLSPRLTVSGAMGVGLSNSYQNPGAASGPGIDITSGAAQGFLANLHVTYRLFRYTTLTLSGAKSISPTILGNLQQSESFGLGVTRQINHESSIYASTNYSHNLLNGTTSDLFMASLGYSYLLTRDLHANMSYVFQSRRDNTGTVNSNTVTFAVTRNFMLHP